MSRKISRELIFGVGINDFAYSSGNLYGGIHSGKCPYYRIWFHVLRRCYDPACHKIRPTYIGCSMEESWHTFSNFKNWMQHCNWRGMHLDKDILLPGNKLYSHETCVFVEPDLNVFLTNRSMARGPYPLGVTLAPRSMKYRARCWNPFTGNRDYLGDFSSPEMAHEAWRVAKHAHACAYADIQPDNRVSAALRIKYSTTKDAY